MNIYLLNIGYIIGVFAVAVVITYLIDIMLCNEDISDSRNGGLIVSLLVGMLSTIMLLLSYY